MASGSLPLPLSFKERQLVEETKLDRLLHPHNHASRLILVSGEPDSKKASTVRQNLKTNKCHALWVDIDALPSPNHQRSPFPALVDLLSDGDVQQRSTDQSRATSAATTESTDKSAATTKSKATTKTKAKSKSIAKCTSWDAVVERVLAATMPGLTTYFVVEGVWRWQLSHDNWKHLLCSLHKRCRGRTLVWVLIGTRMDGWYEANNIESLHIAVDRVTFPTPSFLDLCQRVVEESIDVSIVDRLLASGDGDGNGIESNASTTAFTRSTHSVRPIGNATASGSNNAITTNASANGIFTKEQDRIQRLDACMRPHQAIINSLKSFRRVMADLTNSNGVASQNEVHVIEKRSLNQRKSFTNLFDEEARYAIATIGRLAYGMSLDRHDVSLDRHDVSLDRHDVLLDQQETNDQDEKKQATVSITTTKKRKREESADNLSIKALRPRKDVLRSTLPDTVQNWLLTPSAESLFQSDAWCSCIEYIATDDAFRLLLTPSELSTLLSQLDSN